MPFREQALSIITWEKFNREAQNRIVIKSVSEKQRPRRPT